MKQDTRSSAFRPDIEGLRGIAILLVVIFHCGIPGFSGGFVGVDVFFVLSGYLITGLLVSEIQKSSRLSLLQFYARRARRLLPASALALSITLLLGPIILSPQELRSAGHAARATALYVSNIFFAVYQADYFAPDVQTNPLLHTWSLAVEEQFYLFWPLLIMLGLKSWRSRKALLVVLSGLTVISLAASVWFTSKAGPFAFYSLPTRAWEFSIGGLAVLMPRGTLKLPTRLWLAVGWLGILTILMSGYFISGDAGFPGWIALAPVLGTVVTLVAGAEHPHRGAGILLDSAPLQFFGTLSYSWYLWHWPFLVFSEALFGNISIPGKTAVAAASLVVATITHHLVENPIRFHPHLVKRPTFSLYLAVAVTLCSLSIAFLSLWLAARLANSPEMKSITAAVDDIAKIPRQECVSLGESPEVKKCVFGNASSPTNLVLFGDSHAIQWFNPLKLMSETHGWKLTTIVKSRCPAFDVTPPGNQASFSMANCSIWRAEAIRQIVALRPSVVFLGNATNRYFGRKVKHARQPDSAFDDLRDGTRRTLEALTAAGLSVVAMRDNPLSSYDIPTCLGRSFSQSWYRSDSCDFDKSSSLNPAVFEAEKAGARGLSNVHLLDVTNQLCRENTCWAIQKGMIVYRDSHHLTGRFAESLVPVLEAGLLPILNTLR